MRTEYYRTTSQAYLYAVRVLTASVLLMIALFLAGQVHAQNYLKITATNAISLESIAEIGIGTSKGPMAWTPDGRALALLADWGSIQVYNANSLSLSDTVSGIGDTGDAYSLGNYGQIVFSGNMQRMYVSGEVIGMEGNGTRRRGALRIFNGLSSNVIDTWVVNTAPSNHDSFDIVGGVEDMALSPDNRYLAIATSNLDANLQIMDASSGNILAQLSHDRDFTGDPARVDAVDFSPDGRMLLSGATDGTARLWEVSTWRPLGVLPHPGLVTSVGFSPDNTVFATGYNNLQNDNEIDIQLWSAQTGQLQRLLNSALVDLSDLDFSPDGSLIAVGGCAVDGDYGCVQGGVELFDVHSGQRIAALGGHQDEVKSLAFSPNGTMLASRDEIEGDALTNIWAVRG